MDHIHERRTKLLVISVKELFDAVVKVRCTGMETVLLHCAIGLISLQVSPNDEYPLPIVRRGHLLDTFNVR